MIRRSRVVKDRPGIGTVASTRAIIDFTSFVSETSWLRFRDPL